MPSPTAIITRMITDHTGSAGLSSGRNNKFIFYYQDWELIDMPFYLSTYLHVLHYIA